MVHSKRPQAIPIGLVALLLGLVALLFFGAPGPRFRGRTIQAWVEDLTNGSEQTQALAQGALREIGSNAVPVLLDKLTTPDSWWRDTLANGKGGSYLKITSAAEARRQARKGFLAIGPGGKAAIPELVRLLSSTNLAREAAYILSNLDNEVIPALLVGVTNADPIIRVNALVDLGNRHTNAPGVVPAFSTALKDPLSNVRSSAALALAKIPNVPESVVPVLAELLSDSDPFVRTSAAQTLGSFGPRARAAVPALIRLYQGTNSADIEGLDELALSGQRSMAAQALRAIDREAAQKCGISEPRPFRSYE